MLTITQRATLKAALQAETNADVVYAMSIRGDTWLCSNWLNVATDTNAWATSVAKSDIIEASPMTLYDGLTQGKRDEWRLVLDHISQFDASKQINRDVIVDSWGTASRSVPILQACLTKANRLEVYLGGSNATTNTVTGLVRAYVGTISVNELSEILNA